MYTIESHIKDGVPFLVLLDNWREIASQRVTSIAQADFVAAYYAMIYERDVLFPSTHTTDIEACIAYLHSKYTND